MLNDNKQAQYGMVLSGGGARGLAHIGVYKALIEAEIKPQVLSGSSMGALIGALIAAGYTPDELIEVVSNGAKAKMFEAQIPKLGISSNAPVRKLLKELLPEKFEDLTLPFYVSTTNLTTGENKMWSEGNLIDAVMASTCIPIAFSPIEIEGMQYVDGGLSKNLPASTIRHMCQTLIGSHANYIDKSIKLKSLTEIMERCFRIAIYNTVRTDIELCDHYVNPPEIRHFSTLNFKNIDEIIDVGYRACKAQMPLNLITE
jgi:NTE family protein